MIDSAARATRFETESSAAPAFLWAPPQKPITVSIPLPIVDRLEREAVENFRSLTSRGSELGGLLFGRHAAGSPLAVTIESYEPFDCEYARGPLYRLSEPELAKLDRIVEERRAAGLQPVGFYRSHTRKGLGLDADDLAIFDSRFPEPHQIVLLIRPNAVKASIGAIFIREDGKVRSEASYLEFPFQASKTDAAKRDQGLYDAAVAGPRSVTTTPVAAKPAPRAQIVPIASRREVAPETPLPAPAPPPVVAPPPAPEASEPPAPVAAAPEPAPAPAPAPPPPPVVEAAAPPARSPEPVFEPADPEPEPARKKSGKMLWIALGTAATLALAVGFVFTSGILHRNGPSIPAMQDTSPLALRVERTGSDFVLTWNRESPAVKSATKAQLSISDGPQQENVAMDLAQLRNGSIQYTPVTGDVVFRMEVTGADQMKTTSESVRVLRTRPSPMGDPAAQPTPAPATPTPAAPKTERDRAATAEPAPEPEEEKVKLAQAVKPFQRASLAQRLHSSPAADLPETPALPTTAVPTAPGVNLGSLVGSQPVPPPQAPSSSAPAPPPAATKAQIGGKVEQAQLIRRVREPEFPKLARDAGAGGIVELIATIGADGRVREVRVLRGHSLLRAPAAEAVKTWLYRPAYLNGKPIETQTQIVVTFKNER